MGNLAVIEFKIGAVLIAGPTASGKSALGIKLAQGLDGVVINADSMQVYRDLRIITARPTPEEEAEAPHRLYGHVDAAVEPVGKGVVRLGAAPAGNRSGGDVKAHGQMRACAVAPQVVRQRFLTRKRPARATTARLAKMRMPAV